jgi:hypothetical protein
MKNGWQHQIVCVKMDTMTLYLHHFVYYVILPVSLALQEQRVTPATPPI